MSKGTVRLLISCPDARGIIAAVANFVAAHNGNILDADQHSDLADGEFFMRTEIEAAGFDLTPTTCATAWQEVADRFSMRWRVHWSSQRKRMAILVSKQDHCLSDLLWRWRTGELEVDLPLVISNHNDLRSAVEICGPAFHHQPVDGTGTNDHESKMVDLLTEARVDVLVLARYMQVLSPQFVDRYPSQIINIHHSFLPAFAGASPYQQAYERGVKIIGATSHYVTDQLDHGPIIAQSTLPVGHRDTVDDLIRKGRDLERVVLATAVLLHTEDKTLVSQNKTVVFD